MAVRLSRSKPMKICVFHFVLSVSVFTLKCSVVFICLQIFLKLAQSFIFILTINTSGSLAKRSTNL